MRLTMNNLKDLIKILNVENIVLEDNIDIDKELFNTGNNIKDVRGATFYTFGQGKITNKNVALIIDGNFISNIYTGITEAWFQTTNIIIIALYNSIYDINVRYLDRCSVCNMKFFLKDLEQMKQKIKKSLEINGPKVYNVVVDWNIEESKNDYSKILQLFSEIVKNEDEIYLYNSNQKYERYKNICNIININYKYKYGILSKYIAYLIEPNTSNKILICNSDCFMLDSNILNNRYMNEKFKVLVIDNNKIDKIEEWCNSNKINFIYSNDLKQDLKKIYTQDKATILLVRGGE